MTELNDDDDVQLAIGSRHRLAVGLIKPAITETTQGNTWFHSLSFLGCHYFPPDLRFIFLSVHQMAPPLTEVTDI